MFNAVKRLRPRVRQRSECAFAREGDSCARLLHLSPLKLGRRQLFITQALGLSDLS